MHDLDMWAITNWLGLLVLAPVVVLQYRKRIGTPLTVLWIFCLWNSIKAFQTPWPVEIFFTDSANSQIHMMSYIHATTASACVQMLILPIGILSIPREWFAYWRAVFVALACVDCLLVAFQGYGLFKASSFDMAFIFSVVPLLPLILVPAVATLLTGPRMITALMIFVSHALSYGVVKRRLSVVLTIALGVCLTPWIFHYLTRAGRLDAGRFEAWARFMEWWRLSADPLTGTGFGSFNWIGPSIDHLKNPVFFHMHSDWLQVLFEGGAIGLMLAVWSFVWLAQRSFKRPELFATLIGLGVFGLTYHPLRYFISAAFILCVIREILEVKHVDNF